MWPNMRFNPLLGVPLAYLLFALVALAAQWCAKAGV